MTKDITSYPVGHHPDLPPPYVRTTLVSWVRKNLFSTWYNSILTVVFIVLLSYIVPNSLNWVFFDADFFTSNRNQCTSGGACWGVITNRWYQFLYGFYPSEFIWRPNLAFILLCFALLPILWDKTPYRKKALIFSAMYPLIAWWLLLGGLGLEPVDTDKLGGLLLTLTLGIMGIGFSLPVGIVLALGRQSKMPAVHVVSVIFIEFIRGVPMISLLFMATVLLPLFLPSDVSIDQLIRVIFIVIIFAAAYIAEVVRGGLQAIPRGQIEAANALGLNYFNTMRLIVLPQALKISIPSIVNVFISLFKDTTLVIIVGMFDLLGVGRSALVNKEWLGLTSEVYFFVAFVFFIFCYAMAKYSQYLERKLSTSHDDK